MRPAIPLYISETTRFLEQLKAQRPHLDAEQKEGRALLWDKPSIELDQARRWSDSRVPQKAYPYQTEA
jgi:hypothetical protein